MNDFIIIYLNNIFVYSFTLKQYEKNVNKILKYLNEQDLRIKSKKYVFYRKKIDFLNYIIKRNEIRIDLIKFRAIKN